MKFFLGFNTNRIVSIIGGLFGLYIATLIPSDTVIPFLKHVVFYLSVCAMSVIFLLIVWDFCVYIYHYKKYTNVKGGWDKDALLQLKAVLESRYNHLLQRKNYYYVLYRQMLENMEKIEQHL